MSSEEVNNTENITPSQTETNNESTGDKENCTEENQSNTEDQHVITYRCQQCRIILFKSTDIIPHEATKLRDFANKRRQFADGSNKCSSFFIEKPNWLDARGRMSDTIYCPKCNYKIGHFSWKGSQCSCGEWVKPSFQIPISRVDAI